jgi:integrase
MWIKWLQTEEIIQRPINCPGLRSAVENRTQSEPFASGDLKKIHTATKEWMQLDSKENFGKNNVSKFNKELFRLFLMFLEESGARQHEILQLTWKDVKIMETLSNRKRIINSITVPHTAKRGTRRQVFRGESILLLKELHNKMIQNGKSSDLLFRNQQTNDVVDASTFSRYWGVIKKPPVVTGGLVVETN